MKAFKPPQRPDLSKARNSLFLAGSIDMGAAEDWQTKVTEALKDREVIILNPRRDNWDSSWAQTIDNKNFTDQVNWELDLLEQSEAVLFYFAPGTKAPITLYEFGRFGTQQKAIVYCPNAFYRSGNVHIVCKRMGLPMYTDYDELIAALRGLYPASAIPDAPAEPTPP